MYKSDIRFALDQLTLTPGGPVEGLIQFATVADGLIKSSLTEVVANNDAGIKAAVAQMNLRDIAKHDGCRASRLER
jgi:hypothetical protein